MTNNSSQTHKTQCRFFPQAQFASADNTACLKCEDSSDADVQQETGGAVRICAEGKAHEGGCKGTGLAGQMLRRHCRHTCILCDHGGGSDETTLRSGTNSNPHIPTEGTDERRS
jgi:hypothetical protein